MKSFILDTLYVQEIDEPIIFTKIFHKLFGTLSEGQTVVDSKEESKALRKQYYKNADVIMLCYNIDDIDSFRNIEKYKEM
jgi:GTPase SAR1 family protein